MLRLISCLFVGLKLCGQATHERIQVFLPIGHAAERHDAIILHHYDYGILTSHIKNHWKVGNEMEWRGPNGMFRHEPNKYMKYVMLAAGTGVAPMLGVAKSIVENDEDITSVKLLYSCKTYEDILLKAELRKLVQHWNFTYKTYLSQDVEGETKKGYGENVVARKIKLNDISSELTNIHSTRVLISGTRQYDSAMMDTCRALHVPPENIYKF